LELLHRLAVLFKDYCGILSEEAVRKNFVLIYELLDEVLDFGYPQLTSTELLKPFVFNEPVVLDEAGEPTEEKKPSRFSLPSLELPGKLSNFGGMMGGPVVQAASATNKPIHLNTQEERKGTNEIYVDLIERLTVLFSPTGNILRAEIDGYIRMTSYLQGSPELRLGLNQDLAIGGSKTYGAVRLDDIHFHESAKVESFESDQTVVLRPPDGEFTVLNYRISDDFPLPFKIYPNIEDLGSYRVDLTAKIRLDIPEEHGVLNVVIRIPIPKCTTSAKCELSLPGVQYRVQGNSVEWEISAFQGGSELFLRSRLTLSDQLSNTIRKEFGPISMDFEIPMYNCSNVRIRFLRVMERDGSYNPYRWVRNITQSNSYVCRI